MRDSAWRRLTDLGSDRDVEQIEEASGIDLGDARTTEDAVAAGVRPASLAESMHRAAIEARRVSAIAILSEPQANEVALAPYEHPLIQFLMREARDADTDQVLHDLRERRSCGTPVVIRLINCRVLNQATTRTSHRKRKGRQITLGSATNTLIDREAKRRNVSVSQVIEECVTAQLAQ